MVNIFIVYHKKILFDNLLSLKKWTTSIPYKDANTYTLDMLK